MGLNLEKNMKSLSRFENGDKSGTGNTKFVS